MNAFCRPIRIAALVALAWVTTGLAGTSALVITAPASGMVVAPGQLLTVSVTVISGAYPNGVAIVGGTPAVSSQGFQIGHNPTFSITIPENADAGPFGISAVASNSAGTMIESPEITLDIERPDMPQGLSIQPAAAYLNFVGDSLSLDSATGAFPDGSRLDMRRSSLLQVSSANSAVAVFKNGYLIAAGPGTTMMTFSVGAATQSVRVTVPNSAKGDLNADGWVDNSDVAILDAALDTPAMISSDARDLNGDGRITSADVIVLKTLCTVQKPLCATH